MKPQEKNKRLYLYRTLMAEIKERISYLDGALNKKYNLPDLPRYEICHVQLRIICELIAISCLLAHGDIPAAYSKQILARYEPHIIFKILEGLHPAFYPRPCAKEITLNPAAEFRVYDEDAFLPRSLLVEVHGRTGAVLHSRRVKDIGKPYTPDFDSTSEWRNKIVNHLAVHLISLVHPKRYVVFMMEDPNTGGPSTLEITQRHASPGWLADRKSTRLNSSHNA